MSKRAWLAALLAGPLGACVASQQPKPVIPAKSPPPPAVNPFAGAQLYVDPWFSGVVGKLAARTPEHAASLKKLSSFPTAVWLESVESTKLAATVLEDALRQEAATGHPIVPLFVVYNLPNRDCAAEASNGELSVDRGGEARYQHDFIDVIAATFEAHPRQRIAVVLEPDSLANMATNLSNPRCAAAEAVYRRGIAYAIAKLSLPNVFIYADAAHAGWLGWPRNLVKIVAIFKDVLDLAGGPDRIRGFALNVANYDPARNPSAARGGPDEPGPDEVSYAADLAAALAKVGITGKGFIIDTSRNGRAGVRTAPGNWCNIKGAGLGERPQVAPAPLVDAYVWIKIPGASDGVADPKAPRYDLNCSSDDATPGAPQAGEMFPAYLIELAKNANPPL